MKATVGSVCFVRREGDLLLLHRNHPPFTGKWDGLGGLVEFGEAPEEAARREVWEESRLTVAQCEYRGHLLLYEVEKEHAISAHLFVAEGAQGTLQASEEGLPAWVPQADVQQLDLIGFVHVTLALVLTPGSFLSGTIWHRASGEPVRYALQHVRMGEITTLEL